MQNFKGSLDGFKVNAVDTTGAGDSFVGALLNKIVDDHSIIEVRAMFSNSRYLLYVCFSDIIISLLMDCKFVESIQDESRLKEVLKFANACGAITTTKKGAIPALPTVADALELIKKNAS